MVQAKNHDQKQDFLNKAHLHHAYLILSAAGVGGVVNVGNTADVANTAGHDGAVSLIVEQISEFFEKNFKFSKKNNTDFLIFSYDSLGIEEGRVINQIQSKRSVHPSGKKVFIIQANSITREAQNSLLKMFEEPSSGTHFFLILPRQGLVLPTLLSRLQVVNILAGQRSDKSEDEDKPGTGVVDDISRFADDLLSTPVYKRLIKVGKFLDGEPSKDDLYKILDIFENNLHKNLSKSVSASNHANTDLAWRLEQLLKLKSYLGDRSASIKMILESASLLL